jgi:hypothetical protein
MSSALEDCLRFFCTDMSFGSTNKYQLNIRMGVGVGGILFSVSPNYLVGHVPPLLKPLLYLGARGRMHITCLNASLDFVYCISHMFINQALASNSWGETIISLQHVQYIQDPSKYVNQAWFFCEGSSKFAYKFTFQTFKIINSMYLEQGFLSSVLLWFPPFQIFLPLSKSVVLFTVLSIYQTVQWKMYAKSFTASLHL